MQNQFEESNREVQALSDLQKILNEFEKTKDEDEDEDEEISHDVIKAAFNIEIDKRVIQAKFLQDGSTKIIFDIGNGEVIALQNVSKYFCIDKSVALVWKRIVTAEKEMADKLKGLGLRSQDFEVISIKIGENPLPALKMPNFLQMAKEGKQVIDYKNPQKREGKPYIFETRENTKILDYLKELSQSLIEDIITLVSNGIGLGGYDTSNLIVEDSGKRAPFVRLFFYDFTYKTGNNNFTLFDPQNMEERNYWIKFYFNKWIDLVLIAVKRHAHEINIVEDFCPIDIEKCGLRRVFFEEVFYPALEDIHNRITQNIQKKQSFSTSFSKSPFWSKTPVKSSRSLDKIQKQIDILEALNVKLQVTYLKNSPKKYLNELQKAASDETHPSDCKEGFIKNAFKLSLEIYSALKQDIITEEEYNATQAFIQKLEKDPEYDNLTALGLRYHDNDFSKFSDKHWQFAKEHNYDNTVKAIGDKLKALNHEKCIVENAEWRKNQSSSASTSNTPGSGYSYSQ